MFNKTIEFDLTTPEILDKEYIKKTQHNNILKIVLSLIISSVGLVVMIPVLMNTTSDSFYAILVILLPIIASFLIILYVSIKEIIKVSSIDKYDYYVEEGILENKLMTNYVLIYVYEMKFSGSKKKASTTFDQYTCSEIGDTFYIVTFGKYRFAYNKKFFKLEDESKLRRSDLNG